MRVKEAWCRSSLGPEQVSGAKEREIEQMIDLGDAEVKSLGGRLQCKQVVSRTGEEWIVWFDEEIDEQSGVDKCGICGGLSHLCGLRSLGSVPDKPAVDFGFDPNKKYKYHLPYGSVYGPVIDQPKVRGRDETLRSLRQQGWPAEMDQPEVMASGSLVRLTTEAKACALLEECLDWIGLEDISRRERVLAVEIQERIARLLAQMREGA